VYFSQATITESTFIEEIKVYRHLAGWKKIKMPEKIQIIIDKKAPLISDIPPMEWTNQDYTVERRYLMKMRKISRHPACQGLFGARNR